MNGDAGDRELALLGPEPADRHDSDTSILIGSVGKKENENKVRRRARAVLARATASFSPKTPPCRSPGPFSRAHTALT